MLESIVWIKVMYYLEKLCQIKLVRKDISVYNNKIDIEIFIKNICNRAV